MTEIPSPEQFCLETAPYEAFEIGTDGFVAVLRLQFYLGTLDTYCRECERKSVFQSVAESLLTPGVGNTTKKVSVDDLLDGKTKAYPPYNSLTKGITLGPSTLSELEPFVRSDREFQTAFVCTRDAKHRLSFYFRVWQDKIIKVGQFPSLADLQSPGVRKYRKLLGEERFRELTRAIGLHAHGVGIGAFVYLRRIFEDLIQAAHQEAKDTPRWNEDGFGRARMDEKILALSGHLPPFLVENRAVYSILSLGIHELSELECLGLFGPMRNGIELILDEKLAQQEREKKMAEATREIAAIKGEIKQPRSG